MSEEDDAEYRRRLSEILIAQGFSWVVQQADAAIAEGKSTAKQVAEQQSFSDPDFRLQRPRTSRASLITSEPYNEAERLDILLKGIEAALIQRAQLEQAVLKELHDIPVVRFQPDSLDDTDRSTLGRTHELSPDRSVVAASIEAKARETIEVLRGPRRASSR